MNENECERRKCVYWVIDHCSDHMEDFFSNKDSCCRYHLNAIARDGKKEHLDRIEAVWEKYKHEDLALQTTSDRIIRDLWRAIRREE